jgi:peptidoglycan/xylan/chitin deacetylase (PgdA/CDA1 family)
MKRIVLFCLLLLPALSLSAETSFSGLDLTDDNRLLFSSESEPPVLGPYRTLFLAHLEAGAMRQLSFFPERVTYLAETNQVQIQNRYGVFRTREDLSRMEPVSQFPAFVYGEQVQTGKLLPVTASPDGKYLLYVDPTSFSYGELKLYEVEKNREIVITSDVEVSFDKLNALWSPKSDFFVYCKGGEIYYYSIDQFVNGRVLAEKFRKIGKGKIDSVKWNKQNNLYYITESLVYEIVSGEFFTRAIYSDLLEIGKIIGKIPFAYDPNFDKFWISPDGSRILLNKGGRNIFLYYLGTEDYIHTGDTESLPYLFLPRNTRVKKVVWSRGRIISLLTGSIRSGINKTSLFRFNPEQTDGKMIFFKTDDEDVHDIVLAPDERRIALIKDQSVEIKRYRTWKDDKSFSHDRPLHVVWKSDMELIISGRSVTERVSFQDEYRQTICFSQVERYGFSKSNKNVQVEVSGKVYEQVEPGKWLEKTEMDLAVRKVYSPEYRVYLERSPRGSYRNLVMVRDQKGYEGTKHLFNPPARSYEEFPRKEEPVSFFNFSHGSRIRRREVALVFNAVDGVEGLTEIFNTLADFGFQCTFFVNGEFIRRNPGAVKELAGSGHEIGSLFYTYFNMTDAQFTVNEEFVKQGLARNEDDYFRVSGSELSLLWHAPYYFVNSEIIEAAEEMNYQYIGRDIDTLDWVTEEQARKSDGFYMSAGKLVERIMELKKPGSIIPVRIGTTEGTREDYLFHKLDSLINGLISQGYTIVPVSTLMEHAR